MPIPRVETPAEDGSSYIIDRFDGEIQSMPGLKGTFRFYASQKQTDNGISVFSWDGPESDQGFHHHKKTHDAFLVQEGQMKVYCDGESRILGPGDFASVPPYLIHKPTPLGPITRCIPLIHPADWIEAFRFYRQEFNGVHFPEFDTTEPPMEIPPNWEEDYDTYLEFDVAEPEPTLWSDRDTVLPEGECGYFLKYGTGPRWALGGITSRPFITTKQCSGKFAVSQIESSKAYGKSVFSRKMTFPVHHILVILDGSIDVVVGDDLEASRVHAGEVIMIQKNTPFSIEFGNRYVKFWSYTTGDGIEAIIHEAGSKIERFSLLDEPLPVDSDVVTATFAKFKASIE